MYNQLSTDVCIWQDDFWGDSIDARWNAVTPTGGATVAVVDQGSTGTRFGEIVFQLTSTSEAQAAPLTWGDKLQIPILLVEAVEFEAKLDADLGAAGELAFGLIGDYNATHDNIAQMAVFRKIGTGNILCESDDGTTDKDDIDTGVAWTSGYKRFRIEFAKNNTTPTPLMEARFYVDDSNGNFRRVCESTSFLMNGYTGALQPYGAISKASGTSANGMTWDLVRIKYRRS